MDNFLKYIFVLLFGIMFCGCSAFVRQPHNSVNDSVHNSIHNTVQDTAEKTKAEVVHSLTTVSDKDIKAESIVPPINETLCAIENKLSKCLWVRNNELERYLKNGMKEYGRNDNAAQLNRMSEINLLNLSRKEQAKESRHSFSYSGGLISTWRWYNPEIETLLASPPEERQDISVFITGTAYSDKKYQILRNNAVILSVRGYTDNYDNNNGYPQIKETLKQCVENNSLPVEIRCAAAETLGHLDGISIDDLIPLIDGVKEKQVSKVNPKTGITENKLLQGASELWIELLNSLAGKTAPWELSCFTEALNAKNPKVRLECVKLWQKPQRYLKRDNTELNNAVKTIPEKLPERFLEYAKKESEPLIRAEISEVLGQWKEPAILEIVRSDLNGTAAQRSAAMDALAEAKCREAIPLIKEKLRDPVGRNRAKATEILRRYGYQDSVFLDTVFKQSDDTAWEVRLEVARSLTDSCTPQTKEIAEKYLSDTVRVQEAVLESVSSWQIQDSYPVLLKALQCNLKSIRQSAAEKLSRFVPEAKNYNTDALPRTIPEEYDTLVRRCAELFAEPVKEKTRQTENSSGGIKYENIEQVPDLLSSGDKISIREALEEAEKIANKSTDKRNNAELRTALETLLLSEDPFLQADAAAVLYLFDSEKGGEALQRLAVCPDRKVRLYTARTLGGIRNELRDDEEYRKELIPLLIPLLDDRDDICAAAMISLTKITGTDIGEVAAQTEENNKEDYSDKTSLQRKSARWKKWASERF